MNIETKQKPTDKCFPHFSVAMCVYKGDNPEWFALSIKSILEQTVAPNEVVLVVDGPITEELDQVILQYESNEIFKIIRLEVNQGHGNARRVALKACTHDLVALMDADDISLQDRFEKQLNAFQDDEELSVVGGNISEFIGEPDNIVGYRLVPEDHQGISKYLQKRCPFNQMTVMFKKCDVEKVGGYIDWYCDEDYYLWIRMYLANTKFANIKDVLVNVRVGQEMYRRRGGWRYFKSEAKLQKYMYKNKVIGTGRYLSNIAKRFIMQVLLPNKLRGWVFKKFARSKQREK
ncbi:MAG: glycosyltransferase [Clostridia bacterium]|nr:glycosyltransferase [Clostridia bacterium]